MLAVNSRRAEPQNAMVCDVCRSDMNSYTIISWVPNPRAARLYVYRRGNVCKMCVYVPQKFYNN
jgi:hypothetical protein